MQRTFNGIGSTGGPQSAVPSSLEPTSASTSTSESARSVPDTPQSHRRSLKNRLLACLGMTAGTGADPGGAPTPARNFARPLRRSNRDTEVLAESIRNHCRGLPAATAQRFEHQLANILQRQDARGRLALLSMLEKNVVNAGRGSADRTAGAAATLSPVPMSAPAPTARQQTKLVLVRFNGAEARLTEEQDQQIQAIRLSILKLPHHRAEDYKLLLRDVITSDDPVKRGRLLRQMSEQIAEHLVP